MSNNPFLLQPACLKTLSAVEARPERSNQHEFNGVAQLRNIFGSEKFERLAIFHVRGEPISDRAKVTWYDSRKAQTHRSAEYRLYFQSNKVMEQAREGDNILIGFDRAGDLNCVLIPRGSEGYKSNISTWESA